VGIHGGIIANSWQDFPSCGTITFVSGITAKIGDLGLMDIMEGTYVWVHFAEACPKTLVQLYRGLTRISSNHMASLVGVLVLKKNKVKKQVDSLELQHMFVVCGNSALRTHIRGLPCSNLDGNQTVNDRYWQNKNVLLLANCLK